MLADGTTYKSLKDLQLGAQLSTTMATPAVQQRYRTYVVRLMEFIYGVARDEYPNRYGI